MKWLRNFTKKKEIVITILMCTIQFKKKEVWIEETNRQTKFRLSDHCLIVNKNTNTATGHHFNLPGHGLSKPLGHFKNNILHCTLYIVHRRILYRRMSKFKCHAQPNLYQNYFNWCPILKHMTETVYPFR